MIKKNNNVEVLLATAAQTLACTRAVHAVSHPCRVNIMQLSILIHTPYM